MPARARSESAGGAPPCPDEVGPLGARLAVPRDLAGRELAAAWTALLENLEPVIPALVELESAGL